MTKLNGHQNVNIVPDYTPEHLPGDSFGLCGDKIVSTEKLAEVVTSTLDVEDDIVECIDTRADKNIVFSSETAPDVSLQRESCNLAIMKQTEEKVCVSYLVPQICLDQLQVHQHSLLHLQTVFRS